MSQENREKLLKFLKELPEEQFDYSVFEAENSCGTVGCVAGWCFKLFGGVYTEDSYEVFSGWVLDLTSSEARFLFYYLSDSASKSDAIGRLQWLVDHGSFEGYPIHEESWNK